MSSRGELKELSSVIGRAITVAVGNVRSDSDPLWGVMELLLQARDAVESLNNYDATAPMRRLVEESVARRRKSDPPAPDRLANLGKLGQIARKTEEKGDDTDAAGGTPGASAPADGAAGADGTATLYIGSTDPSGFGL